MIKILKASAGSGKTFRLAKEYIELLLTDDRPEAYRHILAVTFTNKSTDEMKQRILKELDILANTPTVSDYFQDFCPRLYPTPAALARAARERLAAILHDYSAFSVSTIDHFFQRTLRAFSREIGHFNPYQIELDKQAVVTESVERLLDSLNEKDKSLMEWIKESAMAPVKEGKPYKLETRLNAIAKSLLSDDLLNLLREHHIDEATAFDRQHLNDVLACCTKTTEHFETQAQETAREVMDLLKSAYGLDGTSLGSSTKKIESLAFAPKPKGYIEAPAKGFLPALEDSDKWLNNASKKKAPDYEKVLSDPVQRLYDLFQKPFKAYNTARAIIKQIYNLGIAAELRQVFTELQQEKNILSLEESTNLLRDIIGGSDAPFVYEKTGVRYEHFLLDEFQDTSNVQWNNFQPLLSNSVSQHFENLIVGDVKQSIYRFRGSDWKLLDSGVQTGFRDYPVEVESMTQNWRTVPVVVNTNNDFFLFAAAQLDLLGKDKTCEISSIYQDVCQQAMKGTAQDGCVEMVFCQDRDGELAQTLRAVDEYHAMGWDYGDITILTREKEEGSLIAKNLIERGIPVISDDALLVKSSVTVRRLVSQLSLLNTPASERDKDGKQTISSFLASEMHLTAWRDDDSYHSLVGLAEEILRELKKYDPGLFEAEIPYIQAFMDYLQDRVSVDGNDLTGFLLQWKDASPKIAPPEAGHSVRIMTIHKAKGLEFPCVIFPFCEMIELFRWQSQWVVPDTADTELEGYADGAYLLNLAKKSSETLVAEQALQEQHLQLIDNLNLLYVTMTRPKANLRVIGAVPSKKVTDALPAAYNLAAFLAQRKENMAKKCLDDITGNPLAEWSKVSDLLYAFARYGTMKQVEKEEDHSFYRTGAPVLPARLAAIEDVKPKPPVFLITASYPSYPLNGTPDQTVDAEGEALPIGQRNRLKFSAEAADFFGEDGATGFEASPRVMGTVLHDILARVVYPETDLEPAVRDAVSCGLLPADRAGEILQTLRERIADIRGQHPDWFPAPESGCTILNEISLLDRKGEFRRPDRVIISADGKAATIVDYKFGKRNPGPAEADPEIRGYLRQIGRYAGMLREMGYPEVEAYLWYPLADPEEAVITLRQTV